jgi:hypothetical protein
MIMDRESVPADLKRRVLIEAGHRCSIPTCRQIPVEIAHIEPWAKVQTHEFHNLIALCPTCHTRFDNGDIDRKSMLIYKQNLALLNSRYGDIERRILQLFAEKPTRDTIWLPAGLKILILYLLQDGLFRETGATAGNGLGNVPSRREYAITENGRLFVSRWAQAQELE